MPNTNGVNGYNYVTQSQDRSMRRQHMFGGDYRPTDKDSIAVTPDVLHAVRGHQRRRRSARWGLVRQRYDFDVDIGKIDYTRILNTSTTEFSTGFFNSIENGPPKMTSRQPASSATHPSSRASASLPGSTTLGLIPQAVFGNIQSADRRATTAAPRGSRMIDAGRSTATTS
jgi:hypothetical protein